MLGRGSEPGAFLLAKAIGSDDNLTKPPCEWSYHDIFKLPLDEHKQWENACYEELDTLQKCKIYEVINHLKDQKVIWNQWVLVSNWMDRRRPA